MANVINDLKTALGAGARPSKYLISITFPNAVSTNSNLRNIDILARTASFPALTIGQIEVWNQGRKLVQPGDTNFTNSWTTTFYNTEDHDLRRDIIAWQVACDHYQDNMHSGVPANLMIDASVSQLDSAGNPTVTYTFHNFWPMEVSEVSLGADTVDQIEEFDVNWSFTDWVVGNNSTQEPGTANAPTLNETAMS